MEAQTTLAIPGRRTVRPALRSLADNALNAFRALSQNRLRSALTMSGIVIGVMVIVTLVAILQGVKAEVAKQVEGLGANLVLVVPGKTDEMGQPNPMAMLGISPFNDRDLDALRAVPGVEQVSPVAFVSGTIESAKGDITSALVVGTNLEGVVMNPTPLAAGRRFTKTEENQNLCVIGYKPAKELFGENPAAAIGQTLTIQTKKWKVVGVLAKPEGDGTLGNAMLGLSDICYLPDQAVRREIKGGQINRIALKTGYKTSADALVSSLNAALQKSHNGREDFTVITQKKGLAMVIKLVNMAQQLLLLIAAISLFVAGIGIMNIMLVSVTERTREIGIRKTVGARAVDIFAQFLTEAVVLSLFGGVFGLALSAVVCSLVAHYSALTPLITPGIVALAFAVCSTVGVGFGVTPAVRAARLDPIVAMRHE